MATQITDTEARGAVLGGMQEQLDALARRLENGWLLIDQRAAAGEPIAELERYWLRLLREYEELHPTTH